MKNKAEEKKKSFGWKELFGTIKRLKLPWGWIVVGLALNLVVNDLLLDLPDTTASLVSGDLSGGAIASAVWYYVLFGACSVISVAGQAQAQSYGVKKSRDSIWRKMLGIKMEYFDINDPSDTMSTVINDANSGVMGLVNIIIYLLPNIYYVVMAMKRISEYHWVLALSCFMLFPLKYLYAFIMGKKYERTTATLYERIGVLTGFLADRINHLPLIKSYTNEKAETENGKNASNELLKVNMKIVGIDNIATGVVSAIDVLQKFVVVVVAVVLLQRRLIDMAMWLAFFLFSQNLFSYIDQIFDSWVRIKTVKGSFNRIVDVMYGEDEKSGCDIPENGDIRFENVTFGYPGSKAPALCNASFTVERGSSVAIVGLCGSGKTTAVSLIEGFYSPESGRVLIGDTDIKEASLKEFRKKLSFVQQGGGFFSGTLREALTYGVERAVSDDEIFEAAKKTGFIEYIKLCENGLSEEISSDGGSMSGGQAQRLALTREVLRDGDIIIMDEPTSALDVTVSEKIKKLTSTLFADKTRILITHDLDFAKSYDKIVVLSGGSVAGVGTHEELKNTCEVYKKILEGAKEVETV